MKTFSVRGTLEVDFDLVVDADSAEEAEETALVEALANGTVVGSRLVVEEVLCRAE